MSADHVALPAEQLRYPGGKDGLWQSSCSLGDYTSAPYAFPGHAEAAAREHAKAKNGGES